MKKKHLLFLFPFLLLVFGCSKQVKKHSKIINAYSTIIEINLYSEKSNKEIENNLNDIKDIYLYYEKLSEYRFRSSNINNIYTINNANLEELILIPYELYEILELSKSYYIRTNKEFNIAIGYASYKWKECMEKEEYVDLKTYLTDNSYSINLDSLELISENDNYYCKKHENINLDLGAIIKGFVNDKVKKYLSDNNFDKYLINAGSSSILLGNHPENRSFRVGLINPTKVSENYKIINVNNKSITTSGDYEQQFYVDGNMYHHILSNDLDNKYYYHSLSVISDNSTLGDILSTALFSLNVESALELCKSENVDAIFYLSDGNIVKSEGFNYE